MICAHFFWRHNLFQRSYDKSVWFSEKFICWDFRNQTQCHFWRKRNHRVNNFNKSVDDIKRKNFEFSPGLKYYLKKINLFLFLGNKTLITDSCESLCPATCAELSRQTDCVKKCSDESLEITGCFCSGDLLLQDGVCVTTDNCRCSHRGKELIPGTGGKREI